MKFLASLLLKHVHPYLVAFFYFQFLHRSVQKDFQTSMRCTQGNSIYLC